MHFRHAAALALVGWYLMMPTVAGCVENDARNNWPLMMPPIVKTEHGDKIDVSAPLNRWWTAGKYPSRESCEWFRARWPSDAATRQQVSSAKCVYIDDLVVWCLSGTFGKEVPKGCSGCFYTLEIRGFGCVTEFKTEAQCKLGADKYIQDYYVEADKRRDLVVVPPEAKCSEIRPLGD